MQTFPTHKSKDAISSLCPNPIYPVSKTPSLPTPQALLNHIQANKVTTAKLTVKNVMEICRALELDGLIEAIKPMGGVNVDPTYDSDSDYEPVAKRHRSDDDLDPKERERRERKEREKMKLKIKEKKREQRRRDREREKEKKRKEKEKERKRKEKEREKRRKEKEKERKRKEKKKKVSQWLEWSDSSVWLRVMTLMMSCARSTRRRHQSASVAPSLNPAQILHQTPLIPQTLRPTRHPTLTRTSPPSCLTILTTETSLSSHIPWASHPTHSSHPTAARLL